jgi:hypothetical protein
MTPVEVGSAEDNVQLLTNLVTTFRKKEVKYASLKALDQGLEEWWETVSDAGVWTGSQLKSLVEYRTFLINDLGPTCPLSKILEYHRLWSKAVSERRHDMFQVGGYYVPHLFIKAGLLQVARSSGSSPFHHKGGGKRDTATEPGAATSTADTVTPDRKRHPDSGKHAAGSCTKHPWSTTHTTAECRA